MTTRTDTNIVPLPVPPPSLPEPVPLRLTGVTCTGFAIMFLFFGVAGGWAALAPLDSAAVAQGVIKVAGDRKLIQHLEGGICLLYTSPSPRDGLLSRMPSSA